jgi:hypothetical protein
MAKIAKPRKKTSQLYQDISKNLEIVTKGRLLVVDPSSSSRGSQPGYALFEAGVLKDMGVIEIPPSMALNRKLHRLVTALRKDFPQVDVLAIELISPFFARGKGFTGFNKPNVSLQRACGATLGAVECELALEVSPQSWHMHAPEGYVKNDAGDALLMALTILYTADTLLGVDPEPRKKELLGVLDRYRSGRG